MTPVNSVKIIAIEVELNMAEILSGAILSFCLVIMDKETHLASQSFSAHRPPRFRADHPSVNGFDFARDAVLLPEFA